MPHHNKTTTTNVINLLNLTTIMANQKQFQIVAHCDPYHSRFHYFGGEVLKREGNTPTQWVVADGLSLEAAHKWLNDYAFDLSDRTSDFIYEDNDSIKNLINVIAEDEEIPVEEARMMCAWYTKPGFYEPNSHELCYALGDDSLSYDTMRWTIEEV